MRTLVTGAAGFIGYHLTRRLASDGHDVACLDNFSHYYDVSLKHARAEELKRACGVEVQKIDLVDGEALNALMASQEPDVVYHLAAQPGVRYSLDAPQTYVQSNLVGFANVLEACRQSPPRHLLYASSSSAYGANQSHPSAETGQTDHPLSLYAATKKANEALAHSYSHLFNLPMTGLRFFTVYGEWGRPDMAFFKFTDAMRAGRSIKVHNHGRMKRDFTYVGDIVEGLVRLMNKVPEADPAWRADDPSSATSGVAPYRMLNIGNGQPEELMRYIEVLAEALQIEPKLDLIDMQPGEVEVTWADTKALEALTDFRPQTSIEEGIRRFAQWHMAHYPAV